MSSNAEELKDFVKKLQSASSDKETLDLLQILKKEFVVTEALLRESKAGLAVGKLRSHSNKDVSAVAKELVKQWKDAVQDAKASKSGVKDGSSSIKTSLPARKTSMTPATPVTPTLGGGKSDVRTSKTDGIKTNVTGDKTRDSCTDLLYNGLAFESGYPPELILKRARAVEEAVLKNAGSTSSSDYKSKIRSLYVNLKDVKNPGLREGVNSGDISAKKFAGMTSQEMASEERKAEDQKLQEENLHKSLGAAEQQAETDAFECSRCKQRKCRYRQAQTRSADEPMTTFVTCTVCNNRWKFS